MIVSGFHRAQPLIKLADGTLLVGDQGQGSAADWQQSEVSFSEVKWLALDPVRGVTLGRWVEHPDFEQGGRGGVLRCDSGERGASGGGGGGEAAESSGGGMGGDCGDGGVGEGGGAGGEGIAIIDCCETSEGQPSSKKQSWPPIRSDSTASSVPLPSESIVRTWILTPWRNGCRPTDSPARFTSLEAKVGGTYKMSFTNFTSGTNHSFGGEVC